MKCKKKRYESPEMALAFGRNYIEFGYSLGYRVYQCKQCKGFHLTTKIDGGTQKDTVSMESIGWLGYSPIIALIDDICGVNV